jgi:hypothetical protein
LTQDKASEGALKQISRPCVLYIATHGFFLPDHPQDSPVVNRLMQGTFDMLYTSPFLHGGRIRFCGRV